MTSDPKKVLAFARKYGTQARVSFIKAEPCANCDARGQSVNAHCPPRGRESGGMGRKASWRWIVPLCDACHKLRDEKTGSNTAFFAKTGLDLTMAAEWYARNHPPEKYPDDQLAE